MDHVKPGAITLFNGRNVRRHANVMSVIVLLITLGRKPRSMNN